MNREETFVEDTYKFRPIVVCMYQRENIVFRLSLRLWGCPLLLTLGIQFKCMSDPKNICPLGT